jgi:hypothetical protein
MAVAERIIGRRDQLNSPRHEINHGLETVGSAVVMDGFDAAARPEGQPRSHSSTSVTQMGHVPRELPW